MARKGVDGNGIILYCLLLRLSGRVALPTL